MPDIYEYKGYSYYVEGAFPERILKIYRPGRDYVYGGSFYHQALESIFAEAERIIDGMKPVVSRDAELEAAKKRIAELEAENAVLKQKRVVWYATGHTQLIIGKQYIFKTIEGLWSELREGDVVVYTGRGRNQPIAVTRLSDGAQYELIDSDQLVEVPNA